MEQALIYDPRFHTFESWASLLCELYAEQQLEIPTAQTDWRKWGEGVLAIGFFNSQAAPFPNQFDNWEDWASALIGAVNASA